MCTSIRGHTRIQVEPHSRRKKRARNKRGTRGNALSYVPKMVNVIMKEWTLRIPTNHMPNRARDTHITCWWLNPPKTRLKRIILSPRRITAYRSYLPHGPLRPPLLASIANLSQRESDLLLLLPQAFPSSSPPPSPVRRTQGRRLACTVLYVLCSSLLGIYEPCSAELVHGGTSLGALHRGTGSSFSLFLPST